MTLVKCRECESEVSNAAKIRPNCGVKIPMKQTPVLIQIVIGLFLGIIILYFYGGITREFATGWMYDYNHHRPHMTLGGITPKQRLAMAT